MKQTKKFDKDPIKIILHFDWLCNCANLSKTQLINNFPLLTMSSSFATTTATTATATGANSTATIVKHKEKNIKWLNEVLPQTFNSFVEKEIMEFRRMLSSQLEEFKSLSSLKATPSRKRKRNSTFASNVMQTPSATVTVTETTTTNSTIDNPIPTLSIQSTPVKVNLTKEDLTPKMMMNMSNNNNNNHIYHQQQQQPTPKPVSNVALDKSYTDPFIQPIQTFSTGSTSSTNPTPLKTPKVLPWTSKMVQSSLPPPLHHQHQQVPLTPLPKTTPRRTPRQTPKRTPRRTPRQTPSKEKKEAATSLEPTAQLNNSTVKRKRRITQTPTKESPLTRAKRIDQQNSWREKQLREFMNAKAQSLLVASKISAEKDISNNDVVDDAGAGAAAASSTAASSSVDKLSTENSSVESLNLKSIKDGQNIKEQQQQQKQQQQQSTKSQLSQCIQLEEDDLSFYTASALSSNIQQPLSDEAHAIELARRRRLRERNEQALERRKAQLLRAQKLKASVPGLAFLPTHSSTAAVQPFSSKILLEAKQPKLTPFEQPKQQQNNQHKYRIPQEDHFISKEGMPRKDTPKKKYIPAPQSTPPIPYGKGEETPPVPQSAISRKLHNLRPGAGGAKARWAESPIIKSSLQHQNRTLKGEDIFGTIEPVRLEDLFKGKKFERSHRKSSIWPSQQQQQQPYRN